MNINPLNVLNQRQLNWLPEHFECVEISNVNSTLINKFCAWIYLNLSGRFCLVQDLNYNTVIFGFEVGSEASYFALVYQNIK